MRRRQREATMGGDNGEATMGGDNQEATMGGDSLPPTGLLQPEDNFGFLALTCNLKPKFASKIGYVATSFSRDLSDLET